MDFLAEAADQLAKARDANEIRLVAVAQMHSGEEARAARILAEVNERRMEITWACLAGAAIERGLPPCCRHQCPETEEQDNGHQPEH